jgi:hypothetical protein
VGRASPLLIQYRLGSEVPFYWIPLATEEDKDGVRRLRGFKTWFMPRRGGARG